MPRDARVAAFAILALALTDALPPAPLEVELAGCASVRDEGGQLVCETADQTSLHLWTAAPARAPLLVLAGGEPQAVHPEPLGGGLAFELPLPAGARDLLVASGEASFRLRLQPRAREPALEDAEQRRQQGRLDEAEALLTPLLSDPRPVVRARAVGKLARIERWRAHADRAVALLRQALELDRRAGLVSEAVFDGFVLSLTLRDQGRHLADARAVLDDLAPQAARFPQGRAMAHHYRALLSVEVGDLRAALRSFEASDELAEKLGLTEHRVDVLEQKAAALSTLGRHGEARALLEVAGRLLPPKPCAQAQWENDVGWNAIVSREAGDSGAASADAVAPLQRALERYRTTCPNPAEACRSLVNLSHAELQLGRMADARRDLEASKVAAPHPGSRLEAWWLTLDARLLLAEGKAADALARSRELERLAEAEALPDARIEAVSGRARALDALGQVPAARQAYADADALLERWSVLAPLGEGRDGFVASHEAVTRRRLGFLLRRGEEARDPSPWHAEAATAARLARARALAALRSVDRIDALSPEARGRWEQAVERYRRQSDELRAKAAAARDLPADALAAFTAERAATQATLDAELELALAEIAGRPSLAPVLPGALLLVDFPLEDGWAGFAVTSAGTAARRLSGPQTLEQLVGQFRAQVEAAQEIRFAPYGALLRADLHALPWGGAPLLARARVVYPLDLEVPGVGIDSRAGAPADPRASAPALDSRAAAPAADPRASAPAPDSRAAAPADPRAAALPSATPPLAVVVSDPRSDLAAARREGRAVAEALARRGWRVKALAGPAATLSAVRQALESEDTRLLHYAGHGNASGWDGWESGLSLADGELRVPDVLALRRVPPSLVLSACDTAATNDRVPVEGLGVGQAFVLAGAGAVAAAVRPVDDRLAERLMTAFYAWAPERRLELDVAAALRDAQLAESRRQPPGDWPAFRVLAP